MKQQFQVGFVVGKFAPLHLGHCYLIETALYQCQEVWVLSYSQPEIPACEPDRRRSWLNEKFPTAKVIVLDSSDVPEPLKALGWDSLPDNEAQADSHRRLCADTCSTLFGGAPDVVFSSEAYGAPLAKVMSEQFSASSQKPHTVHHYPVDNERLKVSISATEIRSDLHENRKWLPPEVYADFVKRVCFLGAESTGKSTLCSLIAERLKTNYVPEYGRTLWEEQNGHLAFDDLLKIAKAQIELEKYNAQESVQYLLCDTSPLTTVFYSQSMFGKIDTRLDKLAERDYDQVFLCAPDFPLVQDGTRQDEAFRQGQHAWYLYELDKRKVEYVTLRGTLENRINKICERLCQSSKRP